MRKYCLTNEISGETGKGSEEATLGSTPPALRALKQHATLDQLAQTHPLSVRIMRMLAQKDRIAQSARTNATWEGDLVKGRC